MSFIPPQWKVAQIKMILKPNKSLDDPKSYRPISLLPVVAKVFEALLMTRLLPIIMDRKLIPDHQFGFRQKHSTIEQDTDLWKKSINLSNGNSIVWRSFWTSRRPLTVSGMKGYYVKSSRTFQ